MRSEVNEKFYAEIEEQGTVMDYVDDEFVFIIKDEMWTEFELNAFKKYPFGFDFVFKYDIPIFLLTIEDAIDTSDFVFNVYDNEYPESLYQTFAKGSGYRCVFYLLDAQNIVRARKVVQLSSEMSNGISKCLTKQRDSMYNEQEFLCNLEGIQSTWEPFELQPMALFSETIK